MMLHNITINKYFPNDGKGICGRYSMEQGIAKANKSRLNQQEILDNVADSMLWFKHSGDVDLSKLSRRSQISVNSWTDEVVRFNQSIIAILCYCF